MSNSSNTPFPMDYETNQAAFFPPVKGRARAAIICLTITLVLEVIVAGLAFLAGPLLAMKADPAPGKNVMMIIGGLAMLGGGCLFLIAFIVSIVFYCLWIHRATRAARLFEPHFEFTPGWAVGWFFIPLANLVKPFNIIKGLWQVSNGAADPTVPYQARTTPSIISAWWACYIFGSILKNIGNQFQNDVAMALLAAIINLAGTVLIVISGILCIRIIRFITNHLEDLAAQGSLPLTPAPINPYSQP